ncbi:dCTP deaminase [Candidatus Curtissbacteria bacterium]|nr:dCTP deaminase [Candidatus Curtissbacteria bacterium]
MPTKLSPDKAPRLAKSSLPASKRGEKVMVVAREELFKDGIWYGLKTKDIEKYTRLVARSYKFLPRGEVEDDPHWQQIIPYIIFENRGRYFLMHRKGDHTERRLANNYSLGIGGHINRGDIHGANIISWAKREFGEEVSYKGKYKAKFLGLLNDDSNEVGMVHVGLVILFSGDSGEIAVRGEHRSGELVSREDLKKHYRGMETWSRIVVDFLEGKGQSDKVTKSKSKKGTDSFSGILPDWIIAKYLDAGIIKIDPLPANWRENIDQVSMDFHLGGNIKLFRGGTYRFVDTRKGLPEDAMEDVQLKDGDPFILEPGAFAIASTKEILKLPADIVGRLEGKSSLARLGILVHSTAARFDPGWNGAPVLELGNLGPKPAILYCGMPICAFTFEKIAARVAMPYEGSRSDRYSGSRKAVASMVHRASAKTNKDGKRR